MASAVTDLEAGLQAMLNLKPPGVSGSRITSLTSLCVSNIQVSDAIRPRRSDVSPCTNRPHFLVGICSHSKDIHPLQKDSGNPQTWRSLRRRLCNPEMA